LPKGKSKSEAIERIYPSSYPYYIRSIEIFYRKVVGLYGYSIGDRLMHLYWDCIGDWMVLL
jgi:hypothetical protein